AVLERAAIVYARAGEYGVMWIALAFAGALADARKRARWLRAAATVPAALGANYLVKIVVRRKRPRLRGLPPLGREPSTYSFPSAHAATSFAAAEAIGVTRPLLRRPLLAAASAMSLTRPYLGLHYPSDVLAGAILGSVVGRVGARAETPPAS